MDGRERDALELDASEIFAAAAPPGSAGTPTTEAGLAEMLRDCDDDGRVETEPAQCGTRFDLGLAFREVGLLDEAIAEFTLAARDEGRRPECASMIGLCYMEKEMPAVAVQWFDTSLAALRWRE